VRQASKASVRQVVVALVAYVVTLSAVVAILSLVRGTVWQIPISLLPVIPIAFGLSAFVRALGAMDELQQRIHLDAIAFAAGTVALVSVTYGFLQVLAGVPHLSWIWFLPMLSTFWGLGLVLATRKYQ